MNVRFDLPRGDEEPDGSLERARSTDYHVARDPDGDGYLVAFEDGNHVHEVTLNRTPDGWDGDCTLVSEFDGFARCPGFAHHDGPCAHLWAVRSWIAHQHLRDKDERHSGDVDRVVADGGRRR